MAKLGVEVEGRLRGVPTMFVDADEYMNAVVCGTLISKMREHGIRHLYISDRENVLDYNHVGQVMAECLVTMDVTKVRPEPRPLNVTLMVSLPHDMWELVNRLNVDDQVKFHSAKQEVMCVSARHFVVTYPIEFAGDQEIAL